MLKKELTVIVREEVLCMKFGLWYILRSLTISQILKQLDCHPKHVVYWGLLKKWVDVCHFYYLFSDLVAIKFVIVLKMDDKGPVRYSLVQKYRNWFELLGWVLDNELHGRLVFLLPGILIVTFVFLDVVCYILQNFRIWTHFLHRNIIIVVHLLLVVIAFSNFINLIGELCLVLAID